jgi:hypothetical protein
MGPGPPAAAAAGAAAARTAVFPGDTGVTAAAYAYGAVLRAAAGTTRFAAEADRGVAVVSQYTDNGAAYDGDYWSGA